MHQLIKDLKLLKIVPTLFFIFSIACKKTSESTARPTPIQQEQNIPKQEGTVDGGGGGNKICGRPIDAFRVSVTDLPEYKKYIDPIFQYFVSGYYEGCLGCQTHNFAVGAFMSYALFKKGWYIVPCPIGEISKETIGSVYDSEQVAIQTFDEVWIDQSRWNSLREEDKALMILHEVIMAIKILKYDSQENQCLVIAGKNDDTCSGIATFKRGNLKLLTPTDYKEVRIVTSELFRNYTNYDLYLNSDTNPSDSLSSNELFRRYNFSNRFHIWERKKSDKPRITAYDLFRNLRSSKVSGDIPQYTQHEKMNDKLYVASKRCDFDVAYDEIEKKFRFNFRVMSKDFKNIEKALQYEVLMDKTEVLTGYYIDQYKNNLIVEKQNFSLTKEVGGTLNMKRIGDRTVNIDFILNGWSGVDAWELSEMICTDAQNGNCTRAQTFKNSEVNQNCSSEERIELPEN